MDTLIYIKELIRQYECYQSEAKRNIDTILLKFKKTALDKAIAWEKIMDYWDYINASLVVEKALEGKITQPINPLLNSDEVAIVILGIKLNDDGSMNEELLGRLETGLSLAKHYPSAYLVLTGGPTADDNKNVTEGGQMAEWLLEKGIAKERLIVEDRAMDTVGNAIYTYQLLKEKYPQVHSLILVSSDYHVARGSLLYYATLVLEALKRQGDIPEIVANVGYVTSNPGYESIGLQAWSVCQVAGIDYLSLSVELE